MLVTSGRCVDNGFPIHPMVSDVAAEQGQIIDKSLICPLGNAAPLPRGDMRQLSSTASFARSVVLELSGYRPTH